jgi:hypothetical protein
MPNYKAIIVYFLKLQRCTPCKSVPNYKATIVYFCNYRGAHLANAIAKKKKVFSLCQINFSKIPSIVCTSQQQFLFIYFSCISSKGLSACYHTCMSYKYISLWPQRNTICIFCHMVSAELIHQFVPYLSKTQVARGSFIKNFKRVMEATNGQMEQY